MAKNPNARKCRNGIAIRDFILGRRRQSAQMRLRGREPDRRALDHVHVAQPWNRLRVVPLPQSTTMNTPTPTSANEKYAHSGEGKPSDWAKARAYDKFMSDLDKAESHDAFAFHGCAAFLATEACEFERKHEQSEPEDSESIAACLGDDAAHLRGLSKDGAYDEIADNMERAADLIQSAFPRGVGSGEPVEMSPEFTDSARGAIAWVLYHHQGGNSPIGQPLRFALGMGAHEPLRETLIADALRYSKWSKATTADFHAHPAPEAQAEVTPAAYCDPTDPRASRAFSWPGTAQLAWHTTPLYLRPQPSASETSSSSTSLADARDALNAIALEMRTRLVNNGKHTSQTLEAWADRIDAAIEEQRQLRTIAAQRKGE